MKFFNILIFAFALIVTTWSGSKIIANKNFSALSTQKTVVRNHYQIQHSQNVNINPNHFIRDKKISPLFAITVLVLKYDGEGNLWVGTKKHGLWEQMFSHSDFQQNKQIPTGCGCAAILVDNLNNLWIGTRLSVLRGGGLWERSESTQTFVQNKTVPQDDSIRTLFQSKNKNLWVGTYNSGLWQSPPPLVTGNPIFKQATAIGNNMISVIFEDYADIIWVGAINSVVLWKQDGKTGKFESAKTSISSWITTICEDKNLNLWIGTGNDGLWMRTFGQLDFKKNLLLDDNDNIISINADSEDNLWVTTKLNGIWEKQKSGQAKLQKKIYLFWPTSFVVDPDGNALVGTLKNGLWMKSAESQQFLQNTDLPVSASISIVYASQNHNYFIVTKKLGLWEKYGTSFQVASAGNEWYFGGEQNEFVFSKQFQITIVRNDVKQVTINGKSDTETGPNKTFTFPNQTYSAGVNKKIKVKIDYIDNKPSFSANYLIKPTYLDNGNNKDNLNSALASNSVGGVKEYQVKVKKQSAKNVYQLFATFGSQKIPNPFLIIDCSGLNFLTDYFHSSYVPITIKNGEIEPGKIPKIFANYQFVKMATTERKESLYRVDVADLVGNKQHFLVQVGGKKLDAAFSTPKKNKIGKILGITTAILTSVIILFLIYRLWCRRKHVGSNRKILSVRVNQVARRETKRALANHREKNKYNSISTTQLP